jgi:site-specific recombinase XerD
MTTPSLGPILHSFIEDHLKTVKGLRSASVHSYRDVLRLFLSFVATDLRRRITRLQVQDLTFERVLRFLSYLEEERQNRIRTRNHRLAALHTFFEYLATRIPEMLIVAERIAAIPVKRTSPPETKFLLRDEIELLFRHLPADNAHTLRDRALLLFLYNTGARVQEVADLRVTNLDLEDPPRVRLHGKGDKWRSCPLWQQTAQILRSLLAEQGTANLPEQPVFVAGQNRPLTRFGIYKIVRRHTGCLKSTNGKGEERKISPHVFRHTTAVHLLESGVEVNVIRGWLGHATLDTTNRYAEITLKTKEAALRACEPPTESSNTLPRKPVWRDDDSLLKWLKSL